MITQWCSFCNREEADGRLVVLINEEPMPLPCCLTCVAASAAVNEIVGYNKNVQEKLF